MVKQSNDKKIFCQQADKQTNTYVHWRVEERERERERLRDSLVHKFLPLIIISHCRSNQLFFWSQPTNSCLVSGHCRIFHTRKIFFGKQIILSMADNSFCTLDTVYHPTKTFLIQFLLVEIFTYFFKIWSRANIYLGRCLILDDW